MMIVPEMILPAFDRRQNLDQPQEDGAVSVFAPVFFELGVGEESDPGLLVDQTPNDDIGEIDVENSDPTQLVDEDQEIVTDPRADSFLAEAITPIPPANGQGIPIAQPLPLDLSNSRAPVAPEPASPPIEQVHAAALGVDQQMPVPRQLFASVGIGQDISQSPVLMEIPAKPVSLSDAADDLRPSVLPIAGTPEKPHEGSSSKLAEYRPIFGDPKPVALLNPALVSAVAEPLGDTQIVVPLETKPAPSPLRFELTVPTPPSQPAMGREIAAQIVDQLKPLKTGGVELHLSPKELGSVNIRFVPNEAGVFVNITAERPETGELLRRNVDALLQEFRHAGYGGETVLSFSARDNRQDDMPKPYVMQNPPDTGVDGEELVLPAVTVVSSRLNLLL